MSEFHTAFYRTCHIHKDTEYPLWRKCSKCAIVITYSEEEVLILLRDCGLASARNALYFNRSFNSKEWYNQNKKK